MIWNLGTCPYCGKTVSDDQDWEWVRKKARSPKLFFHRSCYMQTTIGAHLKVRSKTDKS